MEYYLVVITNVWDIIHHISLNDTVALCCKLLKEELRVLLAVIVMMILMTLYELIMARDNVFTLSGAFHISSCNLIDINANLCTC